MKTLTITKAVLAAVLTLTPALALTSSVEAASGHYSPAPAHQAPAPQRGDTNANWNNSRNEAPRFDGRTSQNQRFEPSHDQYQGRNVNQREQARFEPTRNDSRFEPRYDDNRGDRNRGKSKDSNNTNKIIGVGIVGAILGAVLSH